MKNLRKLLTLILLASATFGFSQGEANWWYFGYTAGMRFNFGPPVAQTNGLANTSEGSASISDAAGNLLFYTDGITVWNKLHAVMANGTGLLGNSSSTQSGVIIKKPGSATLYYIFTTAAQAAAGGLCYSIVDISLAAGNGSVTVKNTLLQTPTCEKVTGVRHCNNVDVWIVSHDWGSNNFRSFLLTAGGVGAPVVSASGLVATGGTGVTIGQLKASPNGRKLGSCIWDASVNRFEIFDFNNLTGVVSNQILLPLFAASSGAYGCEFSPDGTKFYGTLITPGQIRQWNLCAGSNAAIAASGVLVGTSANNFNGSLQLGPDGKLYVARLSVPWVGVINNPNTLGVACGYVDNGVSLAGKNGSLGLPNFVPFYFKSPPPAFTFTVGAITCLTAQFNAPSSTTTSCAASGYTINAYTWNFGDPPSGALNTSTLTSPTHVYPGPGTYSVTLILNYPCGADTLKQNITVVSPSVTVNTTSATCSVPGSGTATAIGGTGPYTYTWSPSAQTTSVATGLSAGVYTVQVQDAIGCIVTKTTTVLSNNIMTGTVTTTSVMCNGSSTGSASLAITGGTAPFSYTWTGSASTSSVASGLAAGIYTVIGQDVSAICAVTQTLQITQPPALTLTAAASSPTACSGNNITLTGTASGGTGAGYTYTWTAGPTLNTYVVNQPGGSYTYTVSAADANGCLINTNINVNFINNPTLTATSSTICVGQMASLTAGGATSYVWMPGGIIGSTYTVSPGANTTVTVTGANGACTATATAVVNVNPLPVINMAGTNVVCNGQTNGTSTANLVGGNGPFNFVWSSFPVQNTATALGLGAGNYIVTVTDNFGCVNTGSIAITQPLALNLSISSSTTSVCAGSPINLSPNTTGGTGVITYSWNPGPNTGPYTVIETLAGNYGYTVTATDANGCIANQAINLTYNPQPTVTATSATVCAGGIVTLSASGANTYVWMPGGVTGSTFTTNVNSNTAVTVIGTAIGCTGQTSANIAVYPLPNISASTSALKGCVPVCVDLKSSSSSNITAYNWSVNNAGIGSGSITNTCFRVSGTYTVGLTVTDNNGCMNSANPITITADAQPVADFNYDPIKPLEGVDMVTFTDASFSGPIVSWNWYFMNSAQYTSNLQNPNFTYPDAGHYIIALVVKNKMGCSDTILKSIEVGEDYGIYVPNTFTPNGDGLNDIFYGKGYGIKKFEMQIYDRWGEKVFTSTDLNEAWDGSYQNKNAKTVQEGVYSWRIKLTNVFGKSKELTGHVTLIK